MGLATEVANAISEGVNCLCAILEWNDAGAIGAPPVNSVTLKGMLAAVEEAIREILYGGRIVGAEQLFTEEDLARTIRLEALITEWPSAGPLSPEAVTLAEAYVSASCGGASWRELMAAARAKQARS